jgi:hypothetical protein
METNCQLLRYKDAAHHFCCVQCTTYAKMGS